MDRGEVTPLDRQTGDDDRGRCVCAGPLGHAERSAVDERGSSVGQHHVGDGIAVARGSRRGTDGHGPVRPWPEGGIGVPGVDRVGGEQAPRGLVGELEVGREGVHIDLRPRRLGEGEVGIDLVDGGGAAQVGGSDSGEQVGPGQRGGIDDDALAPGPRWRGRVPGRDQHRSPEVGGPGQPDPRRRLPPRRPDGRRRHQRGRGDARSALAGSGALAYASTRARVVVRAPTRHRGVVERAAGGAVVGFIEVGGLGRKGLVGLPVVEVVVVVDRGRRPDRGWRGVRGPRRRAAHDAAGRVGPGRRTGRRERLGAAGEVLLAAVDRQGPARLALVEVDVVHGFLGDRPGSGSRGGGLGQTTQP